MSALTIILVAVGGVLALGAIVLVPRLRKASAFEALELDALPPDLAKRLPVSLHPVIDPMKCMGSGSCVAACPEGKIIALHGGQAHLVHPEACIGHGACARECPVGAITLVFGSATRGVDIPHVTPTFETNVKGIYIAGELGGMGLIRNAVAQGVQAVSHIAKRGGGKDGVHDLVIVGAGPAGLAGALVAKQRGLDFVVIDQETAIGGTIGHYPRKKLVMTGPFDLPGWGRVRQREISKEELMRIWTSVVDKEGLEVRLGERLEGLTRDGEVVVLKTTRGELRARHALLAIGRRGTPRRLGIPGEELAKVAYSLREPEVFAGMDVAVVGGGDSALEAAMSLATSGARVTLSYRGDNFFRAKPKNRERFEAMVRNGTIGVRLGTEPTAITEREIVLRHPDGREESLANDQVLIFAGGELPTKLLAGAGITMERRFGTR
ncbi:MAG: NAD(P)-binding domain-containing protein [Deltaproteobacteria bacterium]|nr:NAD(P)-binding domain-containing protein [Deltaproteobacteria bacterium]